MRGSGVEGLRVRVWGEGLRARVWGRGTGGEGLGARV